MDGDQHANWSGTVFYFLYDLLVDKLFEALLVPLSCHEQVVKLSVRHDELDGVFRSAVVVQSCEKVDGHIVQPRLWPEPFARRLTRFIGESFNLA